MKGRHAAALALVAWLMMPLPLRAASGPIAVSRTADVQKSWYLMSPFPMRPQQFRGIVVSPNAPLVHWKIVATFPTQQAYEAQLDTTPPAPPAVGGHLDQCVASDEPRLKEK